MRHYFEISTFYMSATQTCSQKNLERIGVSCIECDVFLTHPVEIHERLVECRACHRVWFREDPKTYNWTHVDHETVKPKLSELRQKFTVYPHGLVVLDS